MKYPLSRPSYSTAGYFPQLQQKLQIRDYHRLEQHHIHHIHHLGISFLLSSPLLSPNFINHFPLHNPPSHFSSLSKDFSHQKPNLMNKRDPSKNSGANLEFTRLSETHISKNQLLLFISALSLLFKPVSLPSPKIVKYSIFVLCNYEGSLKARGPSSMRAGQFCSRI